MNTWRQDWPTHLILIVGVLLFVFPLWVIFAGSTQDAGAISRGELSLIPDLSGLGVYADVLSKAGPGTSPVWRMLLVSTGMAVGIAARVPPGLLHG